jgi:hypothetical protein
MDLGLRDVQLCIMGEPIFQRMSITMSEHAYTEPRQTHAGEKDVGRPPLFRYPSVPLGTCIIEQKLVSHA